MKLSVRKPAVGVDMGYRATATLHTGEKLNGTARAIAKQLASEYCIVCTETLSPDFLYLGRVLRYISEACARTGSVHIQVSRYFASTRTCSKCAGLTGPSHAPEIRVWACSSCGAVHDRDMNAAQNLLAEGLRLFYNNKAA